jgi:hypothetical protein
LRRELSITAEKLPGDRLKIAKEIGLSFIHLLSMTQAGTAARLGIKPGDRVIFPLFGDAS